jgi:hypothetical protein
MRSVGRKTLNNPTDKTTTNMNEGGQRSMMMTDYKIMNFSDQPVTQLSPTNEDYNGETRSIKSQLPTKSKKSVDQVTLDKY